MTICELKDTVRDDGYISKHKTSVPQELKSGTIIDADKSVNWNREYVENWNKNRKRIIQNNLQLRQNADRQFQYDLAHALQTDYAVNERQAQKIQQIAWLESHSSGYMETIQTACDLTELYIELKTLE